MMIKNINKQNGSVSLFVVIFAALLITVVTVSFVRIMIQDQQQATAADLSQSAYDSAQSGVEDAKRAILRYQTICSSGGDCSLSSQDYKQINSSVCNTAVGQLTDVANSRDATSGEVKIQTNGGNAMDQAYTCVKINLQTDDYLGTLDQNTNKFIPLVGASDFDIIHLEWFSVKDLQGTDMSVDVPVFGDGAPLLSQNIWTSSKTPNRPSIMRSQLIQFNSNGFSLNDFNGGSVNGSSNTLFLYPSSIIDTVKNFTSDIRNTAKNIDQVNCKSSLINNNYSCSVTIKLPTKVLAGDKTAYLNLAAIYKKTDYRVTLTNGIIPVKFDSVQPEIDSTGRANDLFRRVQVRVELNDTNFPFPEAAVDLSDSFCKDFVVTDSTGDFKDNCTL